MTEAREGATSRMAPNTTYILIDYENVHPTEIGTLCDGPFKVKLFLGASQTKIPLTLAVSLQSLGENAEYIQLSANGANALDFHIAYYIGRISAMEPDASFLVVSNDAGFDPLVAHLNGNGISIRRSASLTDFPSTSEAELQCELEFELEAILELLSNLNGSKPRTKKKLINLIRSVYRKELREDEIASLFRALCVRGIVRPMADKLEYDLPLDSEAIPF